jgi:hypothetical protein
MGRQIFRIFFPALFDPDRRSIGDYRCGQDKQRVKSARHEIEYVAGRQQQQPLEPFGNQIVQYKTDR